MSYLISNIDFFLTKHKTNPNELEQKNPKIKQSTIFRIQTGATKDPRRSTLEPFAEWAGVSVSDLFDKDLSKIEENKAQYRNFIGQKMAKQVRIIPNLNFYLDTALDDVEKIEKELRGEGDNPIL